MKDKIYIFIVFGILCILALSAPLIHIFNAAGLIENTDIGNIVQNEHDYSNSFASDVLQKIESGRVTVEYTYLNFMPFYSDIVYASTEVTSSINKPFFDLIQGKKEITPETPTQTIENETSDTASEETKAPDKDIKSVSVDYISSSSTHRYYSFDVTYNDGTTTSFIETALTADREKLEQKMPEQLTELNRIAHSTPKDVNFYFYMSTRFQDTELFEKYIPDEESTYDLFMTFLYGLDVRVKYDYIHVDTLNDRIDKYYSTDHHWNGHGAYMGYCDVINMMRKDSPEIIEPRELGTPFTFEKSKFYGSFARLSSYLRIYDDFTVYDYDFPEHTCEPYYNYESQVNWINQNEYDSPSHNLYGMFYPEIYRIEYPENNTGRRLLILGDSFTQGFTELIASSFDVAVIYYYGNYSGIEYQKVIEENGITDVLFFQFSERIIFDTYLDDKLSSIKTVYAE